MDRVQGYLELVSIWQLMGVAFAALIFFFVVPRRVRLATAIVCTIIWLSINRMPDLGSLQALAKATSILPYFLIIITSLMHAGPRRSVPFVAWSYIILALFAFCFVLRVSDLSLALVIRLQWLTLTVAAVSLARTVVDADDLTALLWVIFLGSALACLVPLSELVLNPAEAFRAGLGRFSPYGDNANQIGVQFALTFALALYFMLRHRRASWRLPLITIAMAALGMALLTASRSTLLLIVTCSLPLLMTLTRRPVLVAFVVIIGFLLVGWIFGSVEYIDLQRLVSLETSRALSAQEYLSEIAGRPLLGLLEQGGLSVRESSEILGYSHNAYVDVLYLGGLAYAAPMFALILYSALSGIYTWRNRHLLGVDPLLITFLTVVLLMTYAHGFVNGSIFYPTHFWAFFHVLLSALFISWAADIRAVRAGRMIVPWDAYPQETYPPA